MTNQSSPMEEQEKLLDESLSVVKVQVIALLLHSKYTFMNRKTQLQESDTFNLFTFCDL